MVVPTASPCRLRRGRLYVRPQVAVSAASRPRKSGQRGKTVNSEIHASGASQLPTSPATPEVDAITQRLLDVLTIADQEQAGRVKRNGHRDLDKNESDSITVTDTRANESCDIPPAAGQGKGIGKAPVLELQEITDHKTPLPQDAHKEAPAFEDYRGILESSLISHKEVYTPATGISATPQTRVNQVNTPISETFPAPTPRSRPASPSIPLTVPSSPAPSYETLHMHLAPETTLPSRTYTPVVTHRSTVHHSIVAKIPGVIDLTFDSNSDDVSPSHRPQVASSKALGSVELNATRSSAPATALLSKSSNQPMMGANEARSMLTQHLQQLVCPLVDEPNWLRHSNIKMEWIDQHVSALQWLAARTGRVTPLALRRSVGGVAGWGPTQFDKHHRIKSLLDRWNLRETPQYRAMEAEPRLSLGELQAWTEHYNVCHEHCTAGDCLVFFVLKAYHTASSTIQSKVETPSPSADAGDWPNTKKQLQIVLRGIGENMRKGPKRDEYYMNAFVIEACQASIARPFRRS